MAERKSFRGILLGARLIAVLGALSFVLWFMIAVFNEKKGGATTEQLETNTETSMRLRTEVRSWFRKTFPESAARASEKFGFFEMDRAAFPVTKENWVILAHGLDEPGNLWADLGPALGESGYNVLEFRYPNDQPVDESSEFLSAELADLIKADPSMGGFHLIGHSMGGLVLRNFITRPDLLPVATWRDVHPVKTLIQLGTPNHGSWLAHYRLPVELRDHLFKDYGMDAILGMVWDGAGEAQLDLKPESPFLERLNGRPFPEDIYWVGIAGTGSPVGLPSIKGWADALQEPLNESVEKIQDTFPEVFKGSGDGVVSIESVQCDEMNEIYYVDAHHRNMVRRSSEEIPPAIPLILKTLN